MTEYDETVKIWMTVPKQCILFGDVEGLIGDGELFDEKECVIDDDDPSDPMGENSPMNCKTFTRTISADRAVKLLEKHLHIKGTSGNIITDIKYLFKVLDYDTSDGAIDFRVMDGNNFLYIRTADQVFMYDVYDEIPDVLSAIRGGRDTDEEDREKAFVWLYDSFVKDGAAEDRLKNFTCPADLKLGLASLYHDTGSCSKALKVV